MSRNATIGGCARAAIRHAMVPFVVILGACEGLGGPDCADTLVIVPSVGQFFVTEEADVRASWAAGGADCPRSYSWSAAGGLTIVGSTSGETIRVRPTQAGAGTLTLRAGNNSVTRDFEIFRNTGDITFIFNGLDEGVEASLEVTGPNGFNTVVRGNSTLTDLAAGLYEWQLNDVTGGPLNHRWGGTTLTGSLALAKNARPELRFTYFRETSQFDFNAVGVPDGATGPFARLDGPNGFSVLFELPRQSVAVEPGDYDWVAFAADPLGFQFTPNVFSGSMFIGAGVNLPLPVPFVGARTFLVIETPGMPAGATVTGELRNPALSIPVTVPSAEYRNAGNYALDVPDLVNFVNVDRNQSETYTPSPRSANVTLPGGQVYVIEIAMTLDSWFANFDAGINLLADPGQNSNAINMPSAMELRGTVHLEPPPATSGDAAAAANVYSITVTGLSPWIGVTGTLAADSSFTAMGSGTVAGFPDVPVTLTGKLNSDGSISGILQMGSETPPVGLPGGITQYTVAAQRKPMTPPLARGNRRP